LFEFEFENACVAVSGAAEELGGRLSGLLRALFASPVFAKYLRIVTSLEPLAVRGEVRRFRAGLVLFTALFNA